MPYRNEFARGDSLWRLLESPSVKEFQGVIQYNPEQEVHELPTRLELERGAGNVNLVVAIDGSTVTHRVENGYPGAEAALFNLAVIIIKLQELRNLSGKRNYIPGPKEMRDLEQCQTLSTVLPGRNIVRKDTPQDSPKRFFRETVSNALETASLDPAHETLLETLRNITEDRTGEITCPVEDCPLTNDDKDKHLIPGRGKSVCECPRKETIYETDILRAHERFEDYGSSAQAFTAVRAAVEHLTLVNILRYFERIDRLDLFRDTAFIMDGPLALFGMPAWLKSHIQKEIARLHQKAQAQGGPGILLMGIEKSGQFLDHLGELDWEAGEGSRQRLDNCTALAPDIQYIHQHIVLRPPDAKPHGEATYYGRPVLYKNQSGQHSVVMTPIVNDEGRDRNCTDPAAYPRIGEALDIMDELSTHLYQDGFAPLVRAHAHAAIPLKTGARILADIFKR